MRRRAAVREERGQAAVEAALLLPVAIAVALIALNLGRYCELCARFDRLSQDLALSHGVAPTGEQDLATACEEAEACLVEALDADDVEVTVTAEPVDPRESGLLLALVPGRVRFVCTMRYRPWPQLQAFGSVALGTPPWLVHRTGIVVDAGAAGLGV